MKDTKKDAAAVALAHNPTAKLSLRRRKEIAKMAAQAPWATGDIAATTDLRKRRPHGTS
jgi:hypothetical protein